MVGRTNVGGGGSTPTVTAWAYIGVEYPSGSVCTATNGTITLTAADTSGQFVFEIPQPDSTPETWTVSCTDGSSNTSDTVSISNQYQISTIRLSYSRLPEGYTEVEYIRNNGYACINTGMTMSNPPVTEFDFAYKIGEYVGASTGTQYYWVRIFGESVSSGSNNYYAATVSGSSGSPIYYLAGAPSAIGSVSVTQNEQRIVKYNIYSSRKVTENGTEVGTCTGSGASSNYIYYGAVNYNNQSIYSSTYQIYLYEFIRKESGVVVQDLVPCKNSSNTVGMYDIVNDQFLTNAHNVDSFTAGPEV